MMASPEVWPAMAERLRPRRRPAGRGACSPRCTPPRRRAATRAAASRPRCSSCPPQGEPWRTLVDLRVDDHPEPLEELERLPTSRDAYDLATEGDELTGEGRHEEAGDRYERASALAPGNHELLFWAGLAAAQAGDLPMALQRVERAIELQPGWRELLDRLEPDVAPGAAAVRDGAGAPMTAAAALRAVVFDLDDTLTDHRSLQLEVEEEIVRLVCGQVPERGGGGVLAAPPRLAARRLYDRWMRGELDEPGYHRARLTDALAPVVRPRRPRSSPTTPTSSAG